MANPFVNEIMLVLAGALAAFFVSFGLRRGSTKQIALLSILFSIGLFVIDRVVWLETERGLVDHAACLVAPHSPACSSESKIPQDLERVETGGPSRMNVAPASPVLPARVSSGSSAVHFGSFSSPARAGKTWQRLQAAHAFMPRGEPRIIEWRRSSTTGQGNPFYRLRSQGMALAEARRLCDQLQRTGQACSIVAPD